MFELLYTSVSPEGLSEESLLEIQLEAQRNNASKNITGMLVYHDREIMQILEGDQETIFSLYESIRLDKRHMLVDIFYSGDIQERAFSDWSMEVVVLKEEDFLDFFSERSSKTNEFPIKGLTKEKPNLGKELFLSLRKSFY